MEPLRELEEAYAAARRDPAFDAELGGSSATTSAAPRRSASPRASRSGSAAASG